MKNEYKLYNRYGYDIILRKINNNEYKLEGDESSMSYIRVGYVTDERKDINFIDPDGGPFITFGYEVDKGAYVNDLFYDKDKKCYIIILSEYKNNIIICYGKNEKERNESVRDFIIKNEKNYVCFCENNISSMISPDSKHYHKDFIFKIAKMFIVESLRNNKNIIINCNYSDTISKEELVDIINEFSEENKCKYYVYHKEFNESTDNDNIENRLINCILKVFGSDFREYTSDNLLKCDLICDLAFDSLDFVELTMEIEKEFKITIPIELTDEFERTHNNKLTIKDILDSLNMIMKKYETYRKKE